MLYGSSMFLTAVASSLSCLNMVELLQLPLVFDAKSLMSYAPTVILYHAATPLPNEPILLSAGIRLIQIDTQKSFVTLYCWQRPPKQYPIVQATDLLPLFA